MSIANGGFLGGYRWFVRWWWGGLWGVLPLVPVQAGDTQPPGASVQVPEDWETVSVRELMQQDLREALGEAGHPAPVGKTTRGKKPPAGASTATVRPGLAPRLVALYGVGRALMAEVQVGRESYLYVKGQAYPAGYAGDRGVYQLRGMNGACIQLEHGADRHALCLRMLLGEVQP